MSKKVELFDSTIELLKELADDNDMTIKEVAGMAVRGFHERNDEDGKQIHDKN